MIVVKPNNSDDRPSIDFDGGNFSATNFSVKMLVLFAYDLKDDQLFGVPKWANELRFDMKAKVLDVDPTMLQKLSNDQKRLIEQTILTERFGLTFHRETRVLSVFELVVDKGGPRFQPSKFEAGQKGANGLSAGSLHTNNHDGNADMASTAVPISSLVNVLSRQMERVVVDVTGLTGRYDLNLTWSRDDGGTPATDQNSPSILTAIQEQLGLRLRPAEARSAPLSNSTMLYCPPGTRHDYAIQVSGVDIRASEVRSCITAIRWRSSRLHCGPKSVPEVGLPEAVWLLLRRADPLPRILDFHPLSDRKFRSTRGIQ